MNEEMEMMLERIREEVISGVTLFLKNVWDIRDCARALKRSESRVRAMACARELPCYKQNGSLYFRREEIEAWLTRHRLVTAEEIDAQAETYCALSRSRGR